MISAAQRKYAKSAISTLDAMWEQRRRWWFCHLSGNLDGEAQAAARAAKLHGDLVAKTRLPDALVKQWEREWDDWFEKKTRSWFGSSGRT